MQSRILLLALLTCVLALAACDAAPRAYDAGTSAIFARQTSDAAGSDANAFEVIAQSENARKTEAARDIETKNAHELAMQNARQTSEAFEAGRADLEKTEDAKDRAQAMSTREAAAQKTATAAAQQTTTRVAENIATATAIIQNEKDKNAALLAAQQVKDEVVKREEQRQINNATIDARKNASYVSELIGVLWLPIFGSALAIVLLMFLWRLFSAVTQYVEAQRFQFLPEPTVIKDTVGNVLGYLTPARGGFVYEQIEVYDDLPAPRVESPKAPLLITDSQDYNPTPVMPPDASLLAMPMGGEIHLSDLALFTKTILESGDWTQATWADKRLPRGYVLSKDTRDEQGNVLRGGYSNLLQLFVDKHLIVERRTGASGRWNPNAPIELDAVLNILRNRAGLPALPEQPAATVSTTPRESKRRVRRAPAVRVTTPPPQSVSQFEDSNANQFS